MTNRVIIGELPGGGRGLRVSVPGADVLSTSLPPKQVAFDSRWPNTVKIVSRGAASISSSGNVTVNFPRTITNPFVGIVFRVPGFGWSTTEVNNEELVENNAADSSSSIESALNQDDHWGVYTYNNRFVVENAGQYDRVSYIIGEYQ